MPAWNVPVGSENPLSWFRTFQQARSAWDATAHAEDLQLAEQERAEILKRYPLDGWPKLPIEDYAQGTGGESFTSWLEHSSPHLGYLPARHAGIHLIFKEGGTTWRIPQGYRNKKEAWTAIRAAYVRAFELAKAGNLAAIDTLEAFKPGRLTLNKALHVYFPDSFLPISANSHLQSFAQRVFGETWRKDTHGRMGHCQLNAAVLTALRALPELAGCSTVALMYFLYGWTDPRQIPTICKIAPGEEGRLWDECHKGGYICVGWDDVGDLKQYADTNSFKKAFFNHYLQAVYKGNKSSTTRKAQELWHMRHLKAGTLIIANKGMSEVLAVGKVQDAGYAWKPKPSGYQHTLSVKWDSSLSGPIPKQSYWGLTTVCPVEPWQLDGILGPLVSRPPDPSWWIIPLDSRSDRISNAPKIKIRPVLPLIYHSDEMRVADRVFVWTVGQVADSAALLTVENPPLDAPAHSVSLRLDELFKPWLSRERILKATGIEALDIPQNDTLTEYRLKPEEAKLLMALLHTPPSAPTFTEILDDLRREHLYFSEETVACFLLSLQAKRFVILTGISGTGKTQLAMALARRFPLSEQVTRAIPDAGIHLTVQPYMLKYNRFILPTELVTQAPALVNLSGSGRLAAVCPGGQESLTLWSGNALQVLLKGSVRRWFEGTFSEGDTFRVTLEEEDDESLLLRIDKPTQQVVENRQVENLVVVAVRPDWTDNRGLLGYLNPITGRYVDTPFLRLLLAAQTEERRALREGRSPHPFFVVLDEMNLARVEHYFSDFLSALESGRPLVLHSDRRMEEGESEEQLVVPQQLPIPRNVFFIGTVNIDETTYMFSPKVLDRAFTIELNEVDLAGLSSAQAAPSSLRLDRWDGELPSLEKPTAADWQELGADPEGAAIQKEIIDLHKLLSEENRHFGYRIANEIARFVQLARAQASDPKAALEALDLALLLKVLPRLHGTQQELSELLEKLLAFAHGNDGGPRFPRMHRKLLRMRRRLLTQGFTAFVE